MKPVEINPATPLRHVGNDISRARANEHSRPAAAAAAAAAVDAAEMAEPPMTAKSSILSTGEEPPMDNDRVAEIRNALREGRYPLLPAKLADHMIAAGFALIDGKAD